MILNHLWGNWQHVWTGILQIQHQFVKNVYKKNKYSKKEQIYIKDDWQNLENLKWFKVYLSASQGVAIQGAEKKMLSCIVNHVFRICTVVFGVQSQI